MSKRLAFGSPHAPAATMYAVEWIAIVLYACGAALEIAGILTVAFEIRDNQRKAEALGQRALPRFSRPGGTAASISRAIEKNRDPVKAAAREIAAAEATLGRQASSFSRHAAETQRQIIDVLVGGSERRALGVKLLILGLLVGMAGNILSVLR